MFCLTSDDAQTLGVALIWLSAAPQRRITLHLAHADGSLQVDVRAYRPTSTGGVSASLIEQPCIASALRGALAEIAEAAREAQP